MFLDRADAGRQLAERLQDIDLRDPLVLGIPRGGVVTGAALARSLGAELDVALARKLRAPQQPELAFGAMGEEGEVYLNNRVVEAAGIADQYLEQERQRQLEEINDRKKRFRTVRPAAPREGRTVILTDDGIATGSTMMAALDVVKTHNPHEVIVAVPVGPARGINALKSLCDRVVFLEAPETFMSVGQFYDSFKPVEDEDVVELLRDAAHARQAAP